MKGLRFLATLFVIGVATAALAGDVQIFCEPGLRVYLDEEFLGTSSEKEDGLFLIDVPIGLHTIRIEKGGFVPQNIQIEVSRFPIEVTVGALSPEPVIRQRKDTDDVTVEKPVGNLIVTSAPQNCVVEIDGESRTKDTPQLSIEGLAAGEHSISFTKAGYEQISGVVTVQPGAEVAVRGNLKDGKVEVVHGGKGALRLISKPQLCTVRFRGEIRRKTHTRLNLTHIPAGQYPIMVSIEGRELITEVWIRDGYRTVLEVDFMNAEQPFSVTHVPK